MAAGIKILLMDDDAILRKLTGKKLLRMGFDIETAREGDEAVAMYQAAMHAGKPYDVVILDLVIQNGLDGKSTIAKLLKIDPGVRAIASSGFVNDATMSTFWEIGFIETLPKPYLTNELEQVIKSVMKKQPSDS
jgi:two-component system cell cycle sensor histidine kinase/response regulator CckA